MWGNAKITWGKNNPLYSRVVICKEMILHAFESFYQKDLLCSFDKSEACACVDILGLINLQRTWKN